MRKLLTICSSFVLLSACTASGSGSITPNPTPNPSGSASTAPASSSSPGGTGTTTSGMYTVTESRESYSAYLGCMAAKHPNSVFAATQTSVNSVPTDLWGPYRANADAQVTGFIGGFGHECGT